MVEYRNAKYDISGTITCDINHPILRWIPFTASPGDVEPRGRAIFEYLSQRDDVEPWEG